jgi:hypothetical protein
MGAVTTPTADRYRALARSSPWRFTTLHLTRRDARGDVVEAWLRRPGRLRVRTGDGRIHRVEGVPHVRELIPLDGSPRRSWVPVDPRDVPVELDADGFVRERPDRLDIGYDDPMWRDYTWVAMLDPVELSTGTVVHETAVTTRHGRTTWWARLTATEHYAPRCSCCPLLGGEAPVRPGAQAAGASDRATGDAAHPGAWLVGLDLATGVVVSSRPLGGDRDDLGFEVTVHEVDDPMAETVLRP